MGPMLGLLVAKLQREGKMALAADIVRAAEIDEHARHVVSVDGCVYCHGEEESDEVHCEGGSYGDPYGIPGFSGDSDGVPRERIGRPWPVCQR